MNSTLKAVAREKILEGLKELPEGWNIKFKLMYGSSCAGDRNMRDVPIEEVVDNIPEEKVDWALTQVENSVKKFKGG